MDFCCSQHNRTTAVRKRNKSPPAICTQAYFLSFLIVLIKRLACVKFEKLNVFGNNSHNTIQTTLKSSQTVIIFTVKTRQFTKKNFVSLIVKNICVIQLISKLHIIQIKNFSCGSRTLLRHELSINLYLH